MRQVNRASAEVVARWPRVAGRLPRASDIIGETAVAAKYDAGQYIQELIRQLAQAGSEHANRLRR